MTNHRMRTWTPVAFLLLLTACGGGSSSAPSVPPGGNEPPVQVDPTFINLSSDPGDYIGGGLDYSYTQADALITVTINGAHLTIRVEGDENWSGDFQLPDNFTRLEAGTYTNLTRYPFHDDAVGGLSWSGEGRGCNTLTGSITIESVTYDGDALISFDLQFEQYCEGGAFALRGDIHWDANDTTAPPGPAAIPAGMWEPAAGVTPGTGNYIYLESEAGDPIGQGATYLYTQETAQLTVAVTDARVSVTVNGFEWWYGDFEGMISIDRIEAGYYGDLQRFPFHNPIKGGLSWYGEGRGCNTLTGWFAVDSVTYDGDTLVAIELRFEQHCGDSDPALHGKIYWDVNDTTSPPGPTEPPAGLWEPPVGATPDTGNYIYLESQAGDYIGQGNTYLYTLATALITVTANDAHLAVSIDGEEYWNGDFQGMNSIARLEAGYYGNLQRYPAHNPAIGGLSWSGEGRGCGSLTGWFVVDSVTYDGDTLAAIELRFEQHCEGGDPALNGKIYWDINDTTSPPGPAEPPAGLWAPPDGATPASGNYVYLESQAGDYIGQGNTYLYTSGDTQFSVTSTGAYFGIRVDGAESWNGNYEGMISITRLEVGYYGNLQRYPFHNPVKGGLSWTGQGRGCNTLTGWFVVDGVTYNGDTLTAIDLRFEQHCEGGDPALNGEVHWAQ